jgi:dolichol-phosphate mannosyltransferase
LIQEEWKDILVIGLSMHEKCKISVVIPVYGAPSALRPLYARLVSSLEQLTDVFEVILVNDACPEGSWEIIEAICAQDERVVGINLSRNFGQMHAITCGIDHCSGDWVVIMDCDLQAYPEDIPQMYRKAMEGYDIVYTRRKNRAEKKHISILSRIYYFILSFLLDKNLDSQISTFTICSKNVINNYRRIKEQYRAFIFFLQWMGFNSTVIELEHHERYEGVSAYSLKKKAHRALLAFISQSNKLLLLSIRVGVVMAVLSVITIIVIVVRYFEYNIMDGWTSMITAIFFIGGLIMISLGVIGLYLGNIFDQVKNRPVYIIRDSRNAEFDRGRKR